MSLSMLLQGGLFVFQSFM